MYLLDTDHFVVLQRRSEPEYSILKRRMSAHQPEHFCLCLVSFHEQVMGANNYITRARKAEDVVRGYQMMEQSLIDFPRFHVLPFDAPAAQQFEAFRAARIRIATMDLRIASIAASQRLTLLSRNLRDFNRVPGLLVQDWLQ
jgi:tRNA(fMet)-specific endonuclease VapC